MDSDKLPEDKLPEAQIVETEEISPLRAGWQRHPILPDTWVTDKGELYKFPPRQREVLVRLKTNTSLRSMSTSKSTNK